MSNYIVIKKPGVCFHASMVGENILCPECVEQGRIEVVDLEEAIIDILNKSGRTSAQCLASIISGNNNE